MNIYFYIFNLNVHTFKFYFKDKIVVNGIYHIYIPLNKILLLFKYKIPNKLSGISVVQI